MRFALPLFVLLTWPAAAQEAAVRVPPGETDPVLRLEGGGPLGPVSAVAFGPNGGTLYEAGWDKVVRVWRRDEETGRFTLDPSSTLRVPIGPGDSGVLNALAVTPDGEWLATGGNAVLPEGAGFRQLGLVVPRESVSDPLAQGIIYVFDLRAKPPTCRQLRGHPGPVQALAFADIPAGRSPVLLSAADEPGFQGMPGRHALVLRLWDLAAGKERDRALGGEFRKFRPWLAAWSLAPDHARIRAAAAWTDSSFLVWDVGAALPRRIDDPYRGRSLVLSSPPDDRGMLLTGHFGEPSPGQGPWPEGYLSVWDVAAPAAPVRKAVVSWAAGRPIPPHVKGMPIAQALVSSRPGGPRDLLAVILQAWTPPERADASGALEYRLQLLDLDPALARFGTVRAQIDLWAGPRVQPFVAPAPDGGRLAVVGNPENEVLVYDVADLLRGRPVPERLGGAGEPIGAAAFVRKGPDDWGLLIRRTPRGAPGRDTLPIGPDDLIFDFMNRRFSPTPAGWAPAAPASNDWQTNLVPPGAGPVPGRPWYLWIYDHKKVVGPGIRILPENEASTFEDVQVTAAALLPPPPRAPGQAPIAAIALVEPGIGPTLWLYDGRTGERVRRLSGHTGPIRSLAFSDDGRFVVSAADDRTACVWSLTDLDRILQARGALPGLVLTGRDGRYVVAEIRRDSPYLGRVDLRPGDVIAGFVEGQGPLQVPGSVLDIYFTAAARKSGQTVTLRRLRAGEVPRDVALTLGQAIDERKPLLTLFMARAGRGPGPGQGQGQGREWLAWNPYGPYDSSGGPGVESLFGWHFNTPDRPEEPARFALASGYPQFRREGLLGDLIREGRLPPPPAPEPLKAPAMELFLDPDGRRDRRDQLRIQQPPMLLGLAIDDRVPPERIESVTWQLDKGEPRPMQAGARFWSADISGITWDRAPHWLTVVLRSREPAARRFQKTQMVRYVPPPPRLLPRIPQGVAAALPTGLVVDDRRFRFVVDVEPTKGVNARVRLVCHHGDEVLHQAEFGPDFAARTIDETIVLKPGANTIEVEAVNEGAEDGLKDDETERFGPLTVHYRPRPVDRPTIRLDSLVLLTDEPGAPAAEATVKVSGTDLGIVSAPRARLEGRIAANEKLRSVEWQYAGRAWEPLAGFAPRRLETFPLGAVLDLIPGRQTICIRARAGNDEAEEATEVATLKIEYRPTVPILERLAAEPRGPIVQPGTGGEPARVTLSARIVGTPERHPLDRATVLIDDEPFPEPPAIDRNSGTLTALIPLRPGTHRIHVQLSNRWNAATVGPIVVEYRRPPRVDRLEAKVVEGRPFAAVSARIASEAEPTRVEVVRRAADAPTFQAEVVRLERAGDTWTASAEVSLVTGENEISVRAWNEDGPSSGARERLSYEKPVEPRPDVLVETPEKANVGRPAFAVKFRVRSASPLARVELVRERSSAVRENVGRFEVMPSERRPDGAFELLGQTEVALEPGPNSFKVVASNAGGESSADLVFTYTPPPVRVVIDGIASGAGGGHLIVPRSGSEGPPSLPEPLPDGAAAVRGRVIWADTDSFGVHHDPRVQVWVNGFPQVAAALGPVPGRPLERAFRADVLLGRLRNEVDVRLSGAPLDIHGDRKLLVDCLKAERDWRLHLWVIGVGVADPDALMERAIASLQGRDYNKAKGTFQTPAFAVARAYGPDCNDLHRMRVYGRLHQIGEEIQLGVRPYNDVMMIYYQGGEVVDDQEPCLRLRPGNGWDRGSLFPLSEIRKRLDETRGAKLFLLDVTKPLGQAPLILSESARWIRDDSPFGLLRFSWPGNPDLTSSDVPPDANLAVTLREALQHADTRTLGEVSADVDRQSLVLKRKYPGLQYIPEFTNPFKGLILGNP